MATPGRQLSEAEQERLRRLRDAGLSIRQIAREERLSPTTVQKNLKNVLAK